jgi:V/A-type H+-transporting ATPase subunit G/H
VDESLKELLEAEQEAERIVREGEVASEEITRKALADAEAIEKQFVDRIPELYKSFADKAHDKAEQTIAEIKLRYDERNKELRRLAEQHEEEAIEQAMRLILKPLEAGRDG